jgi:hypothetical protein
MVSLGTIFVLILLVVNQSSVSYETNMNATVFYTISEGVVKMDIEDFIRLSGKIYPKKRMGYAWVTNPLDSYSAMSVHRFVMGPSEKLIDHINMDKLDNRKSNLRFADKSLNGLNRPSYKKLFKGVRSCSGGFSAYVTIRKQRRELRFFSTELEAAEAVNYMLQRFVGCKIYLNKTDNDYNFFTPIPKIILSKYSHLTFEPEYVYDSLRQSCGKV